MRRGLVGLISLAIVWVMVVGCLAEAPATTPVATPTPGGTATAEQGSTLEASATLAPTATALLEEIVSTRPSQPTATPGLLEQEVTQLVTGAGLGNSAFLGLSATTWVDLGTFLLTVLVAYLLSILLVRQLLVPVVGRTATKLDDELLKDSGRELRRLLLILALQYATEQFALITPRLKTILGDVYFVVGAVLILRLSLRLIRMAEKWYRARPATSTRDQALDPVITMLVRLGIIGVWGIAITAMLEHFGVNITAFAAALGLGGLAISLAARDTVADAIAGMIILVDQPFRVGDRIEIKAVDTWGDVVDVGLRTTRIRTPDNRLVIVPNSSIGSNEIINYSYPDPTYRIQTDVGVAYGSDIEQVRKTLVEAVRQVEGVLPAKPVDALYNEMDGAAMIFRVRFWIETYADTRRMMDRVHAAIQQALVAAGIQIWPAVGFEIDLKMQPQMARQVLQLFWEEAEAHTSLPSDGDGS